MKFWPQIIPHRDLEHLELLELLLWNSICNWNKYHYMLCFGIFTYYILLLGGQEVVSSSLVTRTIENRWYHWVSAVFTFFQNRNLTVLTTNLPTYRNFTDIFSFYFSGWILYLKSCSKTNWERCLNKLCKMA